uniref:Uncharacterized protein n=1 Tax=Arundo donax TaxID=35708 RepID=A0A0A9ASR2_ARUDO
MFMCLIFQTEGLSPKEYGTHHTNLGTN